MKKVISVALALLLCLTAIACADTPSKTTGDLTHTVVNKPQGDPMDGFVFLIVDSANVSEEDMGKYEYELDHCDAEIEKLKNSESIQAYFDNEEIANILGTDEVTLYEVAPVIVGGYEEEFGDVTVSMSFPTEYNEDEKVAVMIGIVSGVDEEGNDIVKWYAYEGFGAKNEDGVGYVSATFDPDILLAMQDNLSYIAIVSAKDAEDSENGVNKPEGFVLVAVDNVSMTDDEMADYETELDHCGIEKQKLAAAESIPAYFDNAKMEALVGAEDLTVSEMHPIIVGGYKPEMGDVTADMYFPTAYEAGEKVAVMIGIVSPAEGEQTVAWSAYEGTTVETDAEAGCVIATFDSAILAEMQAELSIVAIVNK